MAETTGKSIREWMPSILVTAGMLVGVGIATGQIATLKELRAEDMKRIDQRFDTLLQSNNGRDLLLSDIRDRLIRLEVKKEGK